MKQADKYKSSLGALIAFSLMSGCMGRDFVDSATDGFGLFDRSDRATAVAAPAPASTGAALDGELSNGDRSALIDALLNRRSVLPEGPYRQVAHSVLAANARAAEASLRAAMLRSEAREMNWLPTIGPSISLSSLGDVVTGLVLDQTLFDGGAKRAEREFARADVEVAAVALAQDTNDRVFQGLDLYLTAQAAEDRARVNENALTRMTRLEYVMSERVRAGINDRADLQLVQQKLSQMSSDILADREAAAAARAELAAMSATPLSGVSGVSHFTVEPYTAQPLDVMKTEAEGTRGLAEARARQAGYMPNVNATGNLLDLESFGLNLGIPNGLGFGRNADMQAIDAMAQAAERAVSEQREDSNREVASIRAQIASLRRQESQLATTVSQARGNFELFDQQLRAGQRSVPEVVSVFRTALEAERDAVNVRYELARQELKLARIYGLLVNGEDI